MRRHIPDSGTQIAVLARRLDAAETRLAVLDDLTADIAALARGMADLSAKVQVQTDAAASRAVRASAIGVPEASSSPDSQEQTEGQPNWLTVADPVVAAGWLVDVATFVQDVLVPVGAAPGAGCWPLHPGVVAEFLALREEYRAAYAGDGPTSVSEWWSRWLPGVRVRVGEELAACAVERGHRHGGRIYEVPRLDLARVATWWADTHGRDPDEVEAFALTRIT
jgi:hypothetical protein